MVPSRCGWQRRESRSPRWTRTAPLPRRHASALSCAPLSSSALAKRCTPSRTPRRQQRRRRRSTPPPRAKALRVAVRCRCSQQAMTDNCGSGPSRVSSGAAQAAAAATAATTMRGLNGHATCQQRRRRWRRATVAQPAVEMAARSAMASRMRTTSRWTRTRTSWMASSRASAPSRA